MTHGLMTPDIVGWIVGTSFVMIMSLMIIVASSFNSDASRARRRDRQRQDHRTEWVRLKAGLAKSGHDPDYLEFLQERSDKEIT